MIDSVISGNRAVDGGGLVSNDNIILTRSTLAENVAFEVEGDQYSGDTSGALARGARRNAS